MWTGIFLLFAASIPHPRGYVCPRAAGPVHIDGRLNELAWKRGPWTELFVDIEGAAKPTPRFRTRVKMLWDEQFLYIGAQFEEPQPWATLTQHDAVIFQDPDFEVFLDPDADSHNYFEFEINALNTSWDLFLPKPYKDGGSADNSWEIPGLQTAVHVDGTLNAPAKHSRGWTVEIAFPWAAFGHAGYRARRPLSGEQWRINFSRVEWQTRVVEGRIQKIAGTKEDNWVWSAQGKVNMHLPEYWGYVQFEETSKAAFRPDPTWDARMRVQEFYEAQVEFRKRTGHWAGSKEEVGLPGTAVEVRRTATGWQASSGGVSIGEDARITIGKRPM